MVVTQDQGSAVVAHVIGAEHEGLREAVGLVLDSVGDVDAELAAIAEQAVERRSVVGGRDDEDLRNARQHEGRQRVVDHRLVVDGDELLPMSQRNRLRRVPEPPARMMPFMLPPLPGASSCGSRITNNYPYVTIFLHICGPTHANGTQYPHWWCADRIVSLWIVTSVRYPRT